MCALGKRETVSNRVRYMIDVHVCCEPSLLQALKAAAAGTAGIAIEGLRAQVHTHCCLRERYFVVVCCVCPFFSSFRIFSCSIMYRRLVSVIGIPHMFSVAVLCHFYWVVDEKMAKAGVAFGSVDLTSPLRRDVVMTSTFQSSHGLYLTLSVWSHALSFRFDLDFGRFLNEGW